ncbi:MAG: hypothetical protein ACM3ON_04855 [Chloroflexota bacterium]
MKKNTLLIALVLLAVGGSLLHYRIHNFMVPDKLHSGTFIFDGTKFLATLLCTVDVILVTILFMSRKTAVYGYLLNGLLVIYGTVLMAHFSIAEMVVKSIPPDAMLVKSTLPDIGIAWADFFVGKALYDLYTKGPG